MPLRPRWRSCARARVVGAVAGAPIVGVVGRRARAEERQAVGVVVRVEQIGQLRRRSARRSATATTPNTTRLSRPAVSDGRGNRDPQRHARRASASSKSVIHVMPASIGQLIAARDGRFRRRVGRGRERVRADGERRRMSLPVTRDGDAARRSAPSPPSDRAAAAPAARAASVSSCARPRAAETRRTAAAAGRRRRCRTLRRLVGVSTRTIHAARRAPKRSASCRHASARAPRVVARPPVLLPVVLAPASVRRR